MPRVLDIDLDVFVTPISSFHRDVRLPNNEYRVANEDAVREFLETTCRLNRAYPKPGLILEEHDELFDGMKRLVQENRLQVPVDLVHVDAHADLACGQGRSMHYVVTELMHQPLNRRLDPRRGDPGLNRGTVLLFLGACGWLQSLTYAHHPNDGQDLPELFLDFDLDADQFYFQLPRCSQEIYNAWSALHLDWEALKSRCDRPTEIRVPFNVLPIEQLQPDEYDCISITRSPGFTPPSADSLFEVMREYVHAQ